MFVRTRFLQKEWMCALLNLTARPHGTHSTPSYTTTGIPFLSVKDMSSGKLNFSSCKFISNIKYKTQRTIFEMQS